MSSVSCSICWEVVTSTCVVTYLLCGHVYHRNCLNKLLTTSQTCPECRNVVTDTRRIFLNLVADPEIEVINSELIKKSKEYEFLCTDKDIQGAIIKQLEKQINTKDEELLLSNKRNDELKSDTTSTLHENDKLKLELEMQQKKEVHLTTEIVDLRNQLEVSQTKNIEITNSTVALKEFHREQVKQISDLHSEILNLTERLDQFRCLFVVANGKLELQVQQNQEITNERDSLACRNAELNQIIDNLPQNNEYAIDLTQSSSDEAFQLPNGDCKIDFEGHRTYHPKKKKRRNQRVSKNMNSLNSKSTEVSNKSLKIKLVKSKMNRVSNENLNIKLIKSKLNWMCVKN